MQKKIFCPSLVAYFESKIASIGKKWNADTVLNMRAYQAGAALWRHT